jgi:NAD(P)H-hydrate epimerase
MVRPWDGEPHLPEGITALLIGPGLAASDLPESIKHFTQQMWRELPTPVIVDASALAWLQPGDVAVKALRVMTPHPGEAARLLQTTSAKVQQDRLGTLRQLSARFGGCCVVLKGHQTLVGEKEGAVFINSSGNPHLGQGGSGDLLSGYLAGFLAQPSLQGDALLAIRFAVWQHGAVADQLQCERPNWAVADLAAALGGVRPGGRNFFPSP